MDLFLRIHQELGLTVLLVTHTSELVRYGTRAITMGEGKILDREILDREMRKNQRIK